MPTTRRQFIKRSAGLVTVGMVMPSIWLREAQAQSPAGRRILVNIQLAGGWDGLNVVVPYTNSRYQSLRPNLGFKDTDLVDAQGKPTLLDSSFGLHPELSEILDMYRAGKVAIINGVGYPNPNLSHFLSMDIYHTANTSGGVGDGWLGKYADVALFGKPGLPAVNIGGTLPKSLFGDRVVVPSISNFATYTYQTDARFTGDRTNQLNTFNGSNSRSFAAGSYIDAIADTGFDAVAGAAQLQTAVAGYTSPVTYPAGNPLANALRMVAQIATTLPESNLFYVQMGGFDHHSQEIGTAQNRTDKKLGPLVQLLRYFSEGVKAFYDDMAAHGLADNLLMMQWTEFGRRPNENASFGTDHGTCSPNMIIGNPVRGGLMYGDYPSLDAGRLDRAGNMQFTVDFRSIYATILDKWLGADSRAILGASYPDLGFLG